MLAGGVSVLRLASRTRREPRNRGHRHRRDKGKAHRNQPREGPWDGSNGPMHNAPRGAVGMAREMPGRWWGVGGAFFGRHCADRVGRLHDGADTSRGCHGRPGGSARAEPGSESGDERVARCAPAGPDGAAPSRGGAEPRPDSGRSASGYLRGAERWPGPDDRAPAERCAAPGRDASPAEDDPRGHSPGHTGSVAPGRASDEHPRPAARPLVLFFGRVSEEIPRAVPFRCGTVVQVEQPARLQGETAATDAAQETRLQRLELRDARPQ